MSQEQKIEKETSLWPAKVLLGKPRGYCAGVARAIDGLWEFHRRNQEKPISKTTYSYHKIVHNTHVVSEFEEAGVVFVDDITKIPRGANVMFSAHGVSPEVIRQAKKRELDWVDVTCPLVEKPHREVREFTETGFTILYIGHLGHDETEGIIGEVPNRIQVIQTVEDARNVQVPQQEKLAIVTQTTLSLDDTAEIKAILKKRFPNIAEPAREDICFATQNRQDALKEMVKLGARAIVVVGSEISSNSNRLKEVAEQALIEQLNLQREKVSAFLVDGVEDLKLIEKEFYGIDTVGLTSGASTPEEKFQEVVDWFRQRGSSQICEVIVANESKIAFALPKGLRT